MVGINMEQEKVVYKNGSFWITEHPRQRVYDDERINQNDKIYRIHINNCNQPTIEDAGRLVYYLLVNKIYEHKFQEYKEKILDEINKAERHRFYPPNDFKTEWIKKNGV